MCTIITKNHLIGKNYDSVVNTGMLFTNKRGLIKNAAVFPPDRPLEWVSSYGSITFSQSGKEMPVSGINETGLIVEQATLPSTVYPEYQSKPVASSLEATQYLLDTCSSVGQALEALELINVSKSSWPIHFALIDGEGNRAFVEFLLGEKKVCQGDVLEAAIMDNTEYKKQGCRMELRTVEEAFENLEELRAKTTVWSNVYDLEERKFYLKPEMDSKPIVIELDQFDFSPQSRSQMLDIKAKEVCFKTYTDEANRKLISDFFNHPAISEMMNLHDSEGMIDFIANQSKSYDTINEIMLRFLDGEQIKQLPTKETHKLQVLKYLTSKFEFGKDYAESQVNAMIDNWHTFGDYFILRRELIENGLLKRLPNGSKYWRE